MKTLQNNWLVIQPDYSIIKGIQDSALSALHRGSKEIEYTLEFYNARSIEEIETGIKPDSTETIAEYVHFSLNDYWCDSEGGDGYYMLNTMITSECVKNYLLIGGDYPTTGLIVRDQNNNLRSIGDFIQ